MTAQIILHYLWIGAIGLIECFGLAINNKFLQRSKEIPAFISSAINQALWFIVIGIAMDSVHNWSLRVMYIICFATGDILAIRLDKKLEELAKMKGLKLKKKHFRKRNK
jgi:uncharacterized membrane protein YqgA involved in biofilm formation